MNTPKAVEGLVSNGSEQTGVLMGKGTQGFTLTGEKAADAGVHTATATLKDGYVWADGTTGPKSIEYTIEANALDKAKAALQASIDAAQADLESVAESADGSDISPDAQWVTSTAAQELKDAVAAAKASLAALRRLDAEDDGDDAEDDGDEGEAGQDDGENAADERAYGLAVGWIGRRHACCSAVWRILGRMRRALRRHMGAGGRSCERLLRRRVADREQMRVRVLGNAPQRHRRPHG